MSATVLGNIVERDNSVQELNKSIKAPRVLESDVPIGFPKATHRSQSVFAKARAIRNESRPDTVPKISTHSASIPNETNKIASPVAMPSGQSGSVDADWRKSMEQENKAVVEGMSEEERKQERENLISQFGPEIVNLVTTMRVAKENSLDMTKPSSRPRSAMAHSRSGTDESVLSNKTLRKLRFSENPDQVFVYESQPSSPKKVLALLPPPESNTATDSSTKDEKSTNTGELKSNFTKENDKPVDEHAPEVIRERYFPNEPPPSENPTLAWMMQDESSNDSPPMKQSIRYDLHGRVIPPHLVRTLPAHLGLHHHGEHPEEAGYTLDELLMLSRSTLPAQRVVMLQVLARLLARLRGDIKTEEKEDVSNIFQKCLIVAIEAFGDRSSASVRIAGLDVIWTGIADTKARNQQASTLMPTQFDTLPIPYLLSAALFNFTRSSLPANPQIRILQVLTSLVTTTSTLADEIIDAAGLLDGAIRSSYSLESSGEEPRAMIDATYLAALNLVHTLASTSRKCAQSLIPDISDSFLRNIVLLPSSWRESSEPSLLSVVAAILDFYAVLGRYGLGSYISGATDDSLKKLATFVSLEAPFDITEGQELVRAWLALHEVWITCAIDPHQTTPEHDIRWSQVTAWRWSDAILAVRRRMVSSNICSRNLWATWWRVWTMWMEGCRINETDRGRHEIGVWYNEAKQSWDEQGLERRIIGDAVKLLQQPISARSPNTDAHAAAAAFHSFLLLSIEIKVGGCIKIPEVANIDALWGILTTVTADDTWSSLVSANSTITIRIWTNLSVTILRALRVLYTDTSLQRPRLDLQYNTLQRLVPGDEMLASELISDILRTTQDLHHDDLDIPEDAWTAAGGFAKILLPLYQYALWPNDELFIGPFVPHAKALKMTTTLAPSKQSTLPKTPSGGLVGILLPQKNPGDWMVTPLDILLRSGSTHTRLFRTLPQDWSASETEVVRSLLMLLLRRRVRMTRSQILFTCMKVFMLEHSQATQEGEEVYRDALVGALMDKLLQPLRLSSSNKPLSLLSDSNPSLDLVATEFLGQEQPFFQFYSDLIGLYDGISFGHRLFGEILLPPTSQLYPRDYRKLLWGDYSHILRSIQVEVDDMLCKKNELKAWLWPVEGHRDGEMLSIYLKALLKHNPAGFLRFVVIHQIASCLWPDLIGDGNDTKLTAAGNILRVVITSADISILQALINYNQAQEGSAVIRPPHCYAAPSSIKGVRMRWAIEICGEGARSRFTSL